MVAKSFERIHRSNLVGMGVLPCQFKGSDTVASLGINGDETFDVTGIEAGIKPQMDVTLTIHRKDGTVQAVPVLLRIDTPIEVDYYLNGGILPFVLRELMAGRRVAAKRGCARSPRRSPAHAARHRQPDAGDADRLLPDAAAGLDGSLSRVAAGLTRTFAASIATVQLTLSVWVAAFGTMQLVAGPLSDRYGRYPVLAGGSASTSRQASPARSRRRSGC